VLIFNYDSKGNYMENMINVTKDLYQINLPINIVYEDRVVKNFIEYIKIKNISNKSQANDNDIDMLSQDINKSFWENFSKEDKV